MQGSSTASRHNLAADMTCLAINHRRVPIIARQNLNRYNFTKSSTPSSGVITSGDIADSPVMKKIDDNRGLLIIRDPSHKHIQPLTLAYFRRNLIKIR